MGRYWDWQLGERAMFSHLKQRNVVPPAGSKQRNMFLFKLTLRFCKEHDFTGSYTDRLMFICYQNGGRNWKAFCQWTKGLMKMPLYQVGDILTLAGNIQVSIAGVPTEDNPKSIVIVPLDPATDLGSGRGVACNRTLKKLPKIISHTRPAAQNIEQTVNNH